MSRNKLEAGKPFPAMTVPQLGGGSIKLEKPAGAHDWKMVVVYRGKHCPLCTRYLKELNDALQKFSELGVDVAVVSSDSEQRATDHISEISPVYPVGYDLSIEQMQTLGLYISGTGNGTDVERPFAEPGLFVINAEGNLQMVDISNVPFARPSIDSMLMGINFIRSRAEKPPINGTHA